MTYAQENKLEALCYFYIYVCKYPIEKVEKITKNERAIILAINIERAYEKKYGFGCQETLRKDVYQAIIEIVLEQQHSKACSYAYVMRIDENTIKVGKTNNIDKRMYQLKNQYPNIHLLKKYDFTNEEDAYMFEIILHRYFKMATVDSFIPQDRFLKKKIYEEEWKTLDALYKQMLSYSNETFQLINSALL